MEDAVRPHGDVTLVRVLVRSGSTRDGIGGYDRWRRAIRVEVRARPVRGRANAAVEALLSGILGVRASVVSGHTDRLKTMAADLPPEEVLVRLRRAADTGRDGPRESPESVK